MLKHHEDSIQNLVKYYSGNPDILAIILAGSVAKGLERPDSDIDAEIVVSDAYYDRLCKENSLAETIDGYCTYNGGYFDINYFTKDFLRASALRASEPSRNRFIKARCLFSRDTEVEELIPKIGVFQESEKPDKLFSFYCALWINYTFFWQVSKANPYLRVRAAADMTLFGYRLLLQENEVLFPGHKPLMMTVAALQNKPDNILAKNDRLCKELSDEAADDFVNSILNFIRYQPPKDFNKILTRYTDDFETWWYKERYNVAEW